MTVFTATYDPNTEVGAVRQLIFDVDLTVIPTSPTLPARRTWTVLFADEEIQASIVRWGNMLDSPAHIFYAAAELCDAMATNRAWLSRRLKDGDYEKDTKLTAKGLQDQAAIYRALANSIPYEVISDVAWTDPNYARILYNRFIAGV